MAVHLIYQGAKKIIFTACHSGKLKLEFTSPDFISTSPKSFLTSRIDFTVHLLFEYLKNFTCPSGKLKTEFTSPIAKSTSPGLLDTAFFACCSESSWTTEPHPDHPKGLALSVGRIIATGKKLSDDRLAGLQSNQHHTQKMC